MIDLRIANARSWLYVSGARPEHFQKAQETAADGLIFDLEDSVHDGWKQTARAQVVQYLSRLDEVNTDLTQRAVRQLISVRLNPNGSEFFADDVQAISGLGIDVIRLPKVEGATDVDALLQELGKWRRSASRPAVHALIESARGWRNRAEIINHSAVATVSVGEADLLQDVAASDKSFLLPIQTNLVVDLRAANKIAPMMGTYSSIPDLAGLLADTAHGKHLGYFGRAVIHPSHVDVVNSIFNPTREEIAQMQEIVDAVAASDSAAGVVLNNGHFVDIVAMKRAKSVLRRSQL